MDTIDQLIKDGADFFERIQIDGEPDWQREARNIPDDAYPEEDGPRPAIAAADASKSEVERIESLMRQAEEAVAGDGIIDEDAVASMFAAAWLDGAKKEP